jgi:lipid-binding SYLF domain-containing protein
VEQDTNATFTNVVARENGQQVDFEARGINTDLAKAQVITKDEHVEQIDTVLHTDLLNQSKREELLIDLMKTGYLIPEVAEGISQGISNPGQNVLGQVYLNLANQGAKIVIEAKDLEEKLDDLYNSYRDANGTIIQEAELEAKVRELIRPVLNEYGMQNTSVLFVNGGILDPSMSINTVDGKMYVNIHAIGYGSGETMLTGFMHDSRHGTYSNPKIDEAAADYFSSSPNSYVVNQVYVPEGRLDEIMQNTELWTQDHANGNARDYTIYTSVVILLEGGFAVGISLDNGYVIDTQNREAYKFTSISRYFGISVGLQAGISKQLTVLRNINTIKQFEDAKLTSFGATASAIAGVGVDVVSDGRGDSINVIGSSSSVGLGIGLPYAGHKIESDLIKLSKEKANIPDWLYEQIENLEKGIDEVSNRSSESFPDASPHLPDSRVLKVLNQANNSLGQVFDTFNENYKKKYPNGGGPYEVSEINKALILYRATAM